MQIQRVALGKKLYSGSVLLFGDYDNDGYEDLSLSFLDPKTSLPSATLLKNIQCVEIQCGTFNPAFIKQSLTLNLRTFTTYFCDNSESLLQGCPPYRPECRLSISSMMAIWTSLLRASLQIPTENTSPFSLSTILSIMTLSSSK